MTKLLTLTLTLTGLLGAAPAQDAADGAPRLPSMPLASDLRMKVYQPEHADAAELAIALEHLIGQSLVVWDAEHGRPHEARNLQMLGDRLVLYDLPEALERHLEVLRILDVPVAGAQPARQKRELRSYRPRYLSLQSALESLRPLDAHHGPGTLEVQAIEEQGMLALRDEASKLDAALAYLAEVDVPRPQVTITCRLIAPTGSSGATPAVPVEKAVVSELERLTHMVGFEERSYAMLRSTVDLGRRRTLQLVDRTDGRKYQLSLMPSAYDATSRDISFEGCSLESLGGQTEVLFQTSITVADGEATVVGAAGAQPLFVLLRCSSARAD